MKFPVGKSAKDSKYLNLIKGVIDKNHPRNNGVKMQAHHIISAEGVRLSSVANKIEKFGYNINLLPNLVFIPCTLQGACYLGVQPHRGNHSANVDQDDYIDNMEPESYHDMVANRMKETTRRLLTDCVGSHQERAALMVEKLNELSEVILELIQEKPNKAPLTKIAKSFGRNGVGCSGVDSVHFHSDQKSCPVGRRHLFNPTQPDASQSGNQVKEKIAFELKTKYILKPGK